MIGDIKILRASVQSKILVFFLFLLISLVSENSFSSFQLDVDDDKQTQALSDGLIVIRYMFGLSNEQLIKNVIGTDANRTSSEEIEAYLSINEDKIDVDNDGSIDALTDGLLILRDLFGLTGDFLIDGAISENASRTTATQISDYMQTIKDSDADGVFDFEDIFPLDPSKSDLSDVSGEPPNIEWNISISGSREESHGHFIMPCSDGGFLQVGETGFIPNNAKILIVKINDFGQLLWKTELGTLGHNLGNSSIELDDGYIVVGAINEDSAIIKLDKDDGSVIFTKTNNLGGSDAFESVTKLADGFVAVGYNFAEDRENTFFTEGQGIMSFINDNGSIRETKNINSLIAHPYRIKNFNNELIISGLSEEARDYSLIKSDLEGNMMWHREFGGNSYDHNFAFDIGADGSFFLSGHTLSDTQNWDTYTVKLTNDGTILWTRTVGNPRGFDARYIHDEAWGIRATLDGGALVIAGTGDEYESYSECNSLGCSDRWRVYLIKFDANGDILWQTTYGDEQIDWAGEAICLTTNNSAVMAIDNGQFGFVKISPIM